jgi:hypothetical protein
MNFHFFKDGKYLVSLTILGQNIWIYGIRKLEQQAVDQLASIWNASRMELNNTFCYVLFVPTLVLKVLQDIKILYYKIFSYNLITSTTDAT